jgi:hypothetical protein
MRDTVRHGQVGNIPSYSEGPGEEHSRDSAVGIATGCGLDDREVGVRIPVGSRFSLLHVVETGSEVHPTSYPMGTGGSFPGVKRRGREADHSPPTNAEVKKMWIYIHPLPHTPSWRST